MPAFPDIGDGDEEETSSGVPFEFLFEGYREQWTNRASNSTLLARVAWDDTADFLEDILGYTTGVAGQTTFNRYLPLVHPSSNSLFCTDATLVKYPSSNKSNANQTTVIQPPFSVDWAIYQLTFTRLPYFCVENDTITGETIPELFRYCVVADRPRAREFTVNSYALEVEGASPPQPIKQPAFIMDKEQDFFITLCEVPSDVYPMAEISSCLGNINTAAFEIPLSFAAPADYTTFTFAQDTLLFRGVAQEIHQYQLSTGTWVKDIPYFFSYRPGGWRKLPNPSGDGSQVVVKYMIITPTKYLYERADFSKLFKPKA